MARSMNVAEVRRIAKRSADLLRANPRLFAERVKTKLVERPAGRGPVAPTGVSRSLDDVVAELRRRDAAKLFVYADSASREAVAEALPGASITWLSHDAEAVLAGATLPAKAAFDAADAVVVAGPGAKLAYLAVLRECARGGSLPLILWADTGWEMCGSQLPIPADADDADVFLFNHFQDYFLVKDPLLVKITASDAATAVETWRVVQPRHTLQFALSDLLPERSGPAVVDIVTTHPVLTKGRHQRWRVCGDVHWRGSFTTLHGSHDFGNAHHIESRRELADLQSGRVSVLLPATVTTGEPDVTTVVGADQHVVQRATDKPVDELTFDRPAASGSGVYGYRYTGAGTPYWYRFSEEGDALSTLSGNHELSMRIKESPVGLASSAKSSYEELAAAGFMLHPHALPLLPGADVELGFSFLASNPVLRQFAAIAYDQAGRETRRFPLVHEGDGPLFSDAVREHAGVDAALVLFGPDWAAAGADPTLMNAGGDLVARHRQTGDRDVTEFQSCWRNLGATVPKFPHWIHPSNSVTGRTNVLARLRMDGRFRTGLILAHASGRADYERTAVVRVEAVERDGRSSTFESVLPAFTGALWWADEMFAALDPDAAGALMVTSPDADLNVQLVTVTDDGRVSLQHLWGY